MEQVSHFISAEHLMASLSHLHQLAMAVLVYFLPSDCSSSHNPVVWDEHAGPSWVCTSVSSLFRVFL